MKFFSIFTQRRAQAVAEYLILLGLVTVLTLAAFNSQLPRIVKGDGKTGFAERFFHNTVDKINK